MNDYIWLADHNKIYTSYFQGKRKTSVIENMCSNKLLKLYKTIKEPISCNVADVFHSKSTQREIRHSKGTLQGHSKSTLRPLQGHSKDTWALRHSRYLFTWATETLGHSKDTWALEHSKGTWALGHLGTQALRYYRHSKHFI